ncbi:MAG: FHA domain-containing protein, partial [Planctomycetota bacterium]
MAEPLEIVVERDNLQHKMLLEGERVTIGRGAENDVRLDDPLASRVHCRLERLGAEVFVVDLDSNNGTWVDGRRLARRPLALGDTVRVGSTIIHLTGGLSSRLRAAEATRTQETSRERDMLETLLAVMRALHAEENLDRMGALLIDAAVSLTRAERGFVFLVQNGRTRLALGRNFAREPVTAPEKKLSKTLLEKALRSEEPLLLRDAAREDGFAGVASISDLGLRSLLAIPLRHRGQVLGLLLVDHRLASGAFRQDEVKLLSGLASAAANALGAARDRAA